LHSFFTNELFLILLSDSLIVVELTITVQNICIYATKNMSSAQEPRSSIRGYFVSLSF